MIVQDEDTRQISAATGKGALINERDWTQVARLYNESTPFNYVILDDFLALPVLEALRGFLLEHWGWQYRNWLSNELYLKDPEFPEIPSIATMVKRVLPGVIGDRLELVRWWGFMHQRNVGLQVHADNGAVTLDMWLTPDTNNCDPETGGLVFYNFKREPEKWIHEFNTVEYAERDLELEDRRSTLGAVRVGYRYNRAILFDARTYHASESLAFENDHARTQRINFSLLFDDPHEFAARYEQYEAAE